MQDAHTKTLTHIHTLITAAETRIANLKIAAATLAEIAPEPRQQAVIPIMAKAQRTRKPKSTDSDTKTMTMPQAITAALSEGTWVDFKTLATRVGENKSASRAAISTGLQLMKKKGLVMKDGQNWKLAEPSNYDQIVEPIHDSSNGQDDEAGIYA
jgi:hypothetical protein